MIRKELELKSMYSLGVCKAIITDNSVFIKVYGVAGCLKAWLTGSCESLELGNLVNGSMEKEVDTKNYSGILITQSGRQMFYGCFKDDEKENEVSPPPVSVESRDKIFSFNDGYSWRAVTDKRYPSDSLSVRYILSHRSFYNAFLLHGKYFYGENGAMAAVAIECDIKNEPHPFPHLSDFAILRDGYLIVCADTASKKFCEYEY
jgi:hypothetical protein